MDPIDNLAARQAQELQNPGTAPQTLQQIHNELHQMPPDQALHFARALNRDMGGQSPVHERPEVVQGQNGQQVRTGNELLTMQDPFHPGQERIEKQIRQQYLGQPGYAGQPGYPLQPGNGFRPGTLPGVDQQATLQAADRVASELRTPGMQQQAMQEIRNDVYQMRPGEALRFAHRLNQDLGGQSPLHERPETVQGPNGQLMRTGNELLTMVDPYGREQVVKQIRRDNPGQPGYAGPADYVAPQPGPAYPPGYSPGYATNDQPVPLPPPVAPFGLSISIGLPLGGYGYRQPMFHQRRPRW